MWTMKKYPKNSVSEEMGGMQDCQGLSSMRFVQWIPAEVSGQEAHGTEAQQLSFKLLLNTGTRSKRYEKQ